MTKATIDFNQHTVDYKNNWVDMAREFHATGSPVAWTEANGGHWVIASYDACVQAGDDWETFTSENDIDGTGNGGRGQMIPPNAYKLYLGESDPPTHSSRRALEAPFFSPKALRGWRPVVTKFLDEALDKIVPGEVSDFTEEVIIPTTAKTTLYILGYDVEDWEEPAEVAHLSSFLLPGQDGFPLEAMQRLRLKFRDLLAERKAEPTSDIISVLATGTVDGEPLSVDAGESMMNALVFGGFDTTSAAAAHALIYLDQHPEVRERIVSDTAFRKNAVEELLRVNPPGAGMARTAVRDTELMGQKISKGEPVYLWYAAANRDPLKFENPDTIDLERTNARDHLTFSTGPHRCLGSPLAKVELEEIVKTVLERVPSYRIQHEDIASYPTFGLVNGFSRVPFTFDEVLPPTSSIPQPA